MKKLILLLPIIATTGCSISGYKIDQSLTPEQESTLLNVPYPSGIGKIFIKAVNGKELPRRIVDNRSPLALPEGEVELTFICQINKARDFNAKMRNLPNRTVKFNIQGGGEYRITPLVHPDVVARLTPNAIGIGACMSDINQCVSRRNSFAWSESDCLPVVYSYDGGKKIYLDLNDTTKKR